MNARDYLVNLGLAKQGRGRFSQDAIAELKRAIANGVVFDDYDSNGRKPVQQDLKSQVKVQQPIKNTHYTKTKRTASIATQNKQVRPEKLMYGLDKIAGRKTLVVAFYMCAACTRSVSFCNCSNGPQLPKFMGGGPGMLSKPND